MIDLYHLLSRRLFLGWKGIPAKDGTKFDFYSKF